MLLLALFLYLCFMKLSFTLHYRANWGEALHVLLFCQRADGHQYTENLPMETADGYTWSLYTHAHSSKHHAYEWLSYHYQVETADGQVLRKENVGHPRMYAYKGDHDYYFDDFWLEETLYDKYSKRLKTNKLNADKKVISKLCLPLFTHTLLFKVVATGLKTGEALAISGNHPALGAWDTSHLLPMISVGREEWMLSMDVYAAEQVLEYKYVVVNQATGELKYWEEGTNRVVSRMPSGYNEVVVLNGGVFRRKEEKRVAKMVVETEKPEVLANLADSGQISITDFEWLAKAEMPALRYKTYIFDLDGTLLDTLEDLAASCNYALRANGMAERTLEEVRRFVGNGVKKLMERAVPGGLENGKFSKTYADFRTHYLIHSLDTTQPYDGILGLLATLKARGAKLAVVSNKFYAATQELCRHFFGDTIAVAIGERETIRKKPAPDTVLEAMKQLEADAKTTVYIGDSDVDIITAHNCGLPCISVLWGFRDKEFLLRHGATTLVSRPAEILSL